VLGLSEHSIIRQRGTGPVVEEPPAQTPSV
jgi:hypothetical protein